MLGISPDKDGSAAVASYARKMGIPYRVILGDSRTAYKYGQLESLPATFLVDRQGRVAATHLGLVNRKKLDAEIRELVNRSPAPLRGEAPGFRPVAAPFPVIPRTRG